MYKGLYQKVFNEKVTICPWIQENALKYYQRVIEPDITVVYGSFVHLNRYEHLTDKEKEGKLLKYVVLDIPHPPIKSMYVFRSDLICVPSQYSLEILESIGLSGNIISHGVDHDLFPYLERDHTKNPFIYGTLSTNVFRKMIPRIIRAFSLIKYQDSSILLLYCQPKTEHGYDLPLYISTLQNLDSQRVQFPINQIFGVPLDRDELYKPYHTMHVFISASSGEAFSLPPLEAGATGCPVITTEYGASREIFEDAVLYLKESERIETEWGSFLLCDEHDMKKHMEYLFEDENDYKELSRKVFERSKYWKWEKCVDQLQKSLEEILE